MSTTDQSETSGKIAVKSDLGCFSTKEKIGNSNLLNRLDSTDSYCFQDWTRNYSCCIDPDQKEMLQNLSKVMLIINRYNLKVIVKQKTYCQEGDSFVISFDDFDLSEFYSNWSRVKVTVKGIEVSIALFVQKHFSKLMVDDYYFDPTRKTITTENVFNIFEGLLAKQKDHGLDIKPLLDHIRIVLAKGDEKSYQYIMKWMKRSFFRLEKTNVAMVFIGMEGSGKGIFFQKFIMPFLFGIKYSITNDNIAQLLQQFNGFMAHKLFIVADESKEKVSKSDYDKLKSLITNVTREVEFKFKERKTVRDSLNYVFCSNNFNTIPISETCRQFAVFGVDDSFAPQNPKNESEEQHKVCDDYWKRLIACFSKPFAEQFLHFLSTVDDSDFNLEANIPKTDTRENMMLNTMNTTLLFIKHLISTHEAFVPQDGKDDKTKPTGFIKRSDTFTSYNKFCLENSIIKPLNKIEFFKEVASSGRFREVKNGCDGYRLN